MTLVLHEMVMSLYPGQYWQTILICYKKCLLWGRGAQSMPC